MKRPVRHCLALLASLSPILAIAATCPPSGIVYVNHAATGANDGSSWENAYTDLQSALALDTCSSTGRSGSRACTPPVTGTCDVWVAQGTYRPTAGTDRNASFALKTDMAVYGGFAGGETRLEQRNWHTHKTILSGEIGGSSAVDNSYHVVTAYDVEEPTTLDGFTVTGGFANGAGADCGGGIDIMSAEATTAPDLFNLIVENNFAEKGGGICTRDSAMGVLLNVVIRGNSASLGGGMYNTSMPNLMNVLFSGNLALQSGGGLANDFSDPDVLIPIFINVTFSGNRAAGTGPEDGGGAIHSTGILGKLYIADTLIANNEDRTGIDTPSASLHTDSTSNPLPNNVESSLILGCNPNGLWNSACGIDAGNNRDDADPLFAAPISPALAPTSGGDLRLAEGSPAIDVGDDSCADCIEIDLDGNPRIMGTAIDLGPYEHVQYLVTPSAGIHGSISPDSETWVEPGSTLAIATTPDIGYAPSSTVGGSCPTGTWSGNTWTSGAIAANCAPSFSFVTKSWPVAANADPASGGAVECNPNPVPHGSYSVCTAAAAPGYAFTGFSGDCSGSTCVLSNVTANKGITAHFAAKTYHITANAIPSQGGGVSCFPDPVAHDGSATCTATAAAGYQFVGFNGDCSGNTCQLNHVTENKLVNAGFALKTYAITATANPTGAGQVVCAPNPVAHGQNSLCAATPASGYEFTGYSFTGYTGSCPATVCDLFAVTTNIGVTANFKQSGGPIIVPELYSGGDARSVSGENQRLKLIDNGNTGSTLILAANTELILIMPNGTSALTLLSGSGARFSVEKVSIDGRKYLTLALAEGQASIAPSTSGQAVLSIAGVAVASGAGGLKIEARADSASAFYLELQPGDHLHPQGGPYADLLVRLPDSGEPVFSDGGTALSALAVPTLVRFDASTQAGTPKLAEGVVQAKASAACGTLLQAGDTVVTATLADTTLTAGRANGAVSAAVAMGQARSDACGTSLNPSLIETGEALDFSTQEALVNQRLGSWDTKADWIGDPLVLDPFGAHAKLGASVPAIDGYATRLQGNLSQALLSVLQARTGYSVQSGGQDAYTGVLSLDVSGMHIAAWPLGQVAIAGTNDDMALVGNGDLRLAAQGLSTTFGPALVHPQEAGANLEALGFDPFILQADSTLHGAYGNQVFVVQPDWTVEATPEPAGFTLDGKGHLFWTDVEGNRQELWPAFADLDHALSVFRAEAPSLNFLWAWRGEVLVEMGGTPLLIVPDYTLNPTPPEHQGESWWLGNDGKVYIRYPNYRYGAYADFAQGFSVRLNRNP